MRFVVYDDDTMEPITVLNLKGFGEKDIERNGRRWRVAAPMPMPIMAEHWDLDVKCSLASISIVELFFEPFVRTRKFCGEKQFSWMCFTKATALAMLLNPDWLSGQRSAVEYLQKQNDWLTNMLMKVLIA